MNQDLNDGSSGLQSISRSRFRPQQLGQGTISVFTWPGGGAPTALVLGPSSWGFGIGQWGSTAQYTPQQFPSHVQA